MTLPRPVIAGSTYLVTRRTVRRTHLFRPDPALTQLFIYCLGIAAERHGVTVHAAVLMSTHEHLIVTDTRGTLPRFLQQLHRLVALGVQALRKWEGPVWDQRKTSVVTLCTESAIIEKIAYLMANPVAAGVVSKAEDWPGLTTRLTDLGTGVWRARRPDVYFSHTDGKWPDEVEIRLAMPLQIERPVPEAKTVVEHVLHKLVSVARESLGHFKGSSPRNIMRGSPFKRAASSEPRSLVNPVAAAGLRGSQVLHAALRSLREFRRAYRTALQHWCSGNRDIVFPAGTWYLRVRHGANVALA